MKFMKIENYDNNQSLELIFKDSYENYSSYIFIGNDNHYSWKDTVCFSHETIKNFVNWIKKLENKWDYVEINDYDSDAFIKVYLSDTLWHYKILYQIWWSRRDRYTRLTLESDWIGVSNFEKLLINNK